MILTSAQQTLLRSKPHNTKLYLSIYQPTTVLACRVNDLSIIKGARTITFDGVTAGSYALVRSGMTMYVGTSAGADDKGKVRVRSATSSVITVAENSHINWADNDYLTIISFYEIQSIYPRIIQDPSNLEATLWYKDYDIAYTNQNTLLGTFINMGPHYAGFVGDPVYYSASGTSNLKSESLTYDWFFEGATVTGSSAHTPGNITYNTPGYYTTRLTVTASGGAVDTSYRHISIHNRIGTNAPVSKWEFTDHNGSREQGGYTARIKVYETIPPSQLKNGSLVVVFSEDWYGGTKQSIGGNALNRSSIVFVGYVMKGSIQYNWRESTVEFQVGSPSEVMKIAEGFSVSVQYSADPATATSDPNIPSGWVAILAMNIRRAIYHYLRWHSTVLMTNDFEFVGTDRILQYFDADRTSLYDAIQSFMKSTITGNLVCDKQGKLWAERDVFAEPSKYQTTLTLTNQDWIGDASIEEDTTPRTSFIEMGGIVLNADLTSTALLSNAPGVAPNYYGGVERIQGLALTDQNELNALAGSVYAQRNVSYPSLGLNLAGNYQNFDIAPQEIVPVTLNTTDTIRGISFTGKNFYLNRMDWNYDALHESFMPKVSLVEIGSGIAGDTITVPPIPEDGYSEPSIPDVTIPQFDFTGWDTYGNSTISSMWIPVVAMSDYTAPANMTPDPGAESGISCGTNGHQYEWSFNFSFYAGKPTGSLNIYLIADVLYNTASVVFDSETHLYKYGLGPPFRDSYYTNTVNFVGAGGYDIKQLGLMILNWTNLEYGVNTYNVWTRYSFTISSGVADIIVMGALVIWN